MSSSEEKPSSVSVRRLVVSLWPVLKDHVGKFAAGGFLIVVSTSIEVGLPLLVGHTVDIAISAAKNVQLLWVCAGCYLGLILVKAGVDGLQALVIQSAGQNISHGLRLLVFSRIQHLPVAYFDRNPTGRLLTRVINDIRSLSELFTASISVLVLDAMIITGTVLAMVWLHWKLALLVLLTFPIVIFTIRYFGFQLAVAYRKVRVRLAEINAFMGENIGAIATIQRLGAEKQRFEKFQKIVGTHQEAQMEAVQVFSFVQPVANLLNGVSMATLLGMGGYWAIEGKVSVGVLVSFLGYIRNLFQPIRDLVEKYNTYLSAIVSAERVVSILNEPLEGNDEDGAVPGSMVVARTAPIARRYQDTSIVFDGVTFCYPNRSMDALTQVSFSVPSGTSTAIVGATGSGKSTLIRLLLRFYEPTSGDLWVGGQRLRDKPHSEVRRLLGVIHQELYLFQGSLRDNLTLGRGDFSDDYLIGICRSCQLWPLILPRDGLELHVQEGGTNLSMGERQLISFARILILDPPILVLDEATSSVDRLSERQLMANIQEVILGRTSVVIAHRLSTIRECQNIIVLEKGRVVEQGGYGDLLSQNGRFARFHRIQTEG